MPDTPFPIQGSSTDINEIMRRLQQIIEDMYEERIGGALIGDVFEVGADDVLSLNLSDAAGLEKVSGELQVLASSTGGITVAAAGIGAKVRSGYGITVDVNGFALKQQNHEADAAAVSSISASAGADTIDLAAFNTALGTLVTEINAIKTKVNNVLKKLEDAEILKTS